MRTKVFILIALPVLLISCSSPYSKVQQIKEIPNLEEKLAQIDKSNDSSPYIKVLDAIQETCYERNRTALAGMARSMGKMEEQATNRPLSNLDSLKLLYSESNSFAEASNAKQINCLDVLSYWRKQHKQMMQEEANDTKQEEIMNLGK